MYPPYSTLRRIDRRNAVDDVAADQNRIFELAAVGQREFALERQMAHAEGQHDGNPFKRLSAVLLDADRPRHRQFVLLRLPAGTGKDPEGDPFSAVALEGPDIPRIDRARRRACVDPRLEGNGEIRQVDHFGLPDDSERKIGHDLVLRRGRLRHLRPAAAAGHPQNHNTRQKRTDQPHNPHEPP